MPSPVPHALVLLSLDKRDDAVLAVATSLARSGVVERLCLLHVDEAPRRFGRARAASASPEHEREVAGFTGELSEAAPGVDVRGRSVSGRATEEVARMIEADECDLVVMGRSEAADGRPAWGDHGLRVLRLADAPVLVVPDGHPGPVERALVGMDLSDDAADALAMTVRLAPSVTAVAVVDRAAEGLDDEAYAGFEADLRGRYRALVEPRLEGAPVPPLRILDGSSPADALLAAAGEADVDLLVIGSRGLTPLAAVLLGSTAERLGGRCPSPLLVWRKRGRQRGLLSALWGG